MRGFSLALMLGYQDIRQAYRRSALGSFWITLGMAFQIGVMGLVFSLIFKISLPDYLPYLASGIILWGFISTTLSEGCYAFINAEGLIKEVRLPLFIHVLRTVWRNIITLGHNIIIFPVVVVVLGAANPEFVYLAIPGLALLLLNISWLAFLVAVISTRYRDVPQIIASALMAFFYLTPVMWNDILLGDNQLAHWVLGLNPFYHWLQIVRLPLLGAAPTLENWTISFVTFLIGYGIVLLTRKRAARSVPYWL